MKHANGTDIVSIMPIEAFLDHRLTLIQVRVLGALLSYRNKASGTAIVKRSTLAERCGYPERKISSATTALENLGWLKKIGKGGHSRPCEYAIQVPELHTETVPESGTVPESATERTVPESGTPTVPESGTPTVPESGTRKEQSVLQSFEQSLSVVNAREAEIQDSPDQPDVTANRRGELSAFLRQQGVNVTPMNPHLCQWVNSDLTDDEAQDAVDRARISKPAPAAIPAAYLAAIVPKVIAERSERLKKCPAVAATTPGALSSTNPNRGHHHARQNATQQRASINTFLRNASNPDGVVELTPEQFEHHRLAVPENGGMLREPLDFAVSVGRRVNHPFIEVVEQYPVWVN